MASDEGNKLNINHNPITYKDNKTNNNSKVKGAIKKKKKINRIMECYRKVQRQEKK